jgi:transcriptional regulator with XRE-family HTH domain
MAGRRERLAGRREALGFTQESFARKIGVELMEYQLRRCPVWTA